MSTITWRVSNQITDNTYAIRHVVAVSTRGCVVAHVNYAFPDEAMRLLLVISSHDALVAAAESALIALGRAGGNMAGGPFRKEWEQLRAALAAATE